MTPIYDYVDYNPATGRWALPFATPKKSISFFRAVKLHYLLHKFRRAKRKQFYERAVVDPSTMRPSVV